MRTGPALASIGAALPLALALVLILVGCRRSDSSDKFRNVKLVNMVFSEIWSKGDVNLIDGLFADDFVGHFPAATLHGRLALVNQVKAHRSAFPDWTEEVEDTIAEGDRVAVRFTSHGTNLGEFLGNPPTGNRVAISEVAIFRLSNGRIVEQWVYPDLLSLQRQLSKKAQKRSPSGSSLTLGGTAGEPDLHE